MNTTQHGQFIKVA